MSGAWWRYWRCVLCQRVESYPPPPVVPGTPVCTYGGHPLPQPMVEVEVRVKGEAA